MHRKTSEVSKPVLEVYFSCWLERLQTEIKRSSRAWMNWIVLWVCQWETFINIDAKHEKQQHNVMRSSINVCDGTWKWENALLKDIKAWERTLYWDDGNLSSWLATKMGFYCAGWDWSLLLRNFARNNNHNTSINVFLALLTKVLQTT